MKYAFIPSIIAAFLLGVLASALYAERPVEFNDNQEDCWERYGTYAISIARKGFYGLEVEYEMCRLDEVIHY